MKYLSKQSYERKLTEIRKRNESIARRRMLKKERTKYAPKLKPPSTSKLLLWTIVILCLEIVGFCEYAFFETRDSSFLYVLAGIPTTLVPTIISYYNKAKCENVTGGIVYETAMANMETNGEEAVG